DRQMLAARPANPVLAVLLESGLRHRVDAQLLARDVLRARRADAAGEAEGRAVVRDPPPPLGPVGDIGHAILHVPGRLRHEEVRRKPDEVEVTVRGDPLIAPGVPPLAAPRCGPRAPAPPTRDTRSATPW